MTICVHTTSQSANLRPKTLYPPEPCTGQESDRLLAECDDYEDVEELGEDEDEEADAGNTDAHAVAREEGGAGAEAAGSSGSRLRKKHTWSLGAMPTEGGWGEYTTTTSIYSQPLTNWLPHRTPKECS